MKSSSIQEDDDVQGADNFGSKTTELITKDIDVDGTQLKHAFNLIPYSGRHELSELLKNVINFPSPVTVFVEAFYESPMDHEPTNSQNPLILYVSEMVPTDDLQCWSMFSGTVRAEPYICRIRTAFVNLSNGAVLLEDHFIVRPTYWFRLVSSCRRTRL